MFLLGRFFRDLRSIINYPFWLLNKNAPDNHLYKILRVRNIGKKFSCETFIETGTFYGQMVHAVKDCFKYVLSIELYEPLYKLNKTSFKNSPHIKLYYGDSALKLTNMLDESIGRVLFWLDGHFSGDGTAGNIVECPILNELIQISRDDRQDHCILIDDARLFDGNNGYPTFDDVKKILLNINSQYQIEVDGDCIVAVPPISMCNKV